MSLMGYVHAAMEFWGMIFCLIAAGTILGKGSKDRRIRLFVYMQLLTAILLLSDAFAWIYRGNASPEGYYIVRVSNFLVYALQYMILFLYSFYIKERIRNLGGVLYPWFMISLAGLCAAELLLLVLTQFFPIFYYFDAGNFYHRAPLFMISQLLGFAGMMLDVGMMIKNSRYFDKVEFMALISYIVLPIGAVILQFFMYGIAFTNIAITASMLLMYISFLSEQSQRMMEQERLMVLQERLLLEQKQKLGNLQVQLIISQIQPHFLYNCLNAIYYLCEKDYHAAQNAISEFSDYLRGNLDALREDEPIPFERELAHIKHYLSLEKMRYDDELKVVYDIKTSNFKLPALSVQPLVENAVKHEVGKTIGGGTVTLRTREEADAYRIEVLDDGVGYDIKEKKEDGRSHIGVENVSNRLRSMCGAELTVTSEKGKGTKAEIWLPKNKTHRQSEILEISQRKEGSRLTVALKGRLDTLSAPQLEEVLHSELRDVTELVIDMQELEYITSAGLRVVLAAKKIMTVQGSMELQHVNELIREVFRATGFGDILTIQ